jgi:predicted nicotinamide N-methyase
LARFVLDHPDVVRGADVVDFATGSGMVAIAAARSGARRVVAIDVDPLAVCACRLNAAANRVSICARTGDPVGDALPWAHVVLAGDVWYDARAAGRFGPWLSALAGAGARVLTGDPGRAYAPAAARELAAFDVPTPPELEGCSVRKSRVLEISA